MLQFAQHKVRHEQGGAEEARLTDVGNAPVNDYTGIQQDVITIFLGAFFHHTASAAEDGVERTEKTAQIVLSETENNHAQIAKQDRRCQRCNLFERSGEKGEWKREERGSDQAHENAEDDSPKLLRRHSYQAMPDAPNRPSGQIWRQNQAGEGTHQGEDDNVRLAGGIEQVCHILARHREYRHAENGPKYAEEKINT